MKSSNPFRIFFSALAVALALVLPVAGAESTLASGSWSKKEHAVSGTWKIVEDGGVRKLQLTGFKTKSAPDLKIFFSAKPLSQLSGKNAAAGSYRLVKLKSAKGDQSYTLPQGVDLSKYKTMVIHCEKYSKLWAGASL